MKGGVMRWWIAAFAVPVLAALAFGAWVYATSEGVLHPRYRLPASVVLAPAAGGPDLVEWQPGWKGRWRMAAGKFPPGLAFMADARAKAPKDLGPATERGRHLAAVACAECHRSDLMGEKGVGRPPDLAIAGA